MFVEQLGRELFGAQLAIWQGTSGLPAEQETAIKDRWIRQVEARKAVVAQMQKTGRKTGGCGCGKKS